MGIIGLACANTYGQEGLAVASVYGGVLLYCLTYCLSLFLIFIKARRVLYWVKLLAKNPLILSIAAALLLLSNGNCPPP